MTLRFVKLDRSKDAEAPPVVVRGRSAACNAKTHRKCSGSNCTCRCHRLEMHDGGVVVNSLVERWKRK